MALPSTSWTDETLPALFQPYLRPEDVDVMLVTEDGYALVPEDFVGPWAVVESLPTTAWAAESLPSTAWTDE